MVSQAELIFKVYHCLVPGLISFLETEWVPLCHVYKSYMAIIFISSRTIAKWFVSLNEVNLHFTCEVANIFPVKWLFSCEV